MHKDIFPTAAALVDHSTFMDDFAAGEGDNGAYHQLPTYRTHAKI
jgi:hypothetical protein